MKIWILFLLLPVLAIADDTARIANSKAAVDSIVTSRTYLSTTLGITVLNSIIHPDWVQIDFPLISSSGVAKRRIEAAVRDLIAKGGEPAYRDSTAGLPRGQYIRLFVPGRVYVHRDIAIDVLKRVASGVDTTGVGVQSSARDTLQDGGWRLYLGRMIPGRF